uniref:FTH domain-containing protein n=1 Tax=Caenorhabditis tropicalis TaxID=1561998 RepID=A0A1I7V0K6_9PELO
MLHLQKLLEEDLEGESKLMNGNAVFEEITTQQIKNKVSDILNNGTTLGEVLRKLIIWRDYLKIRSEPLNEAFQSEVISVFTTICIRLARPFNELLWQELENLDTDLNKIQILINGIPTNTLTVIPTLKQLLKEFEVKISSAQVFPFDLDSFGIPPINCKKIWNPLIWLRLEIEKLIEKSDAHDEPHINQVITSLNQAPKEGYFSKLAIASFFLEKTADNLDYSKHENKEKFLDNLKLLFGTTKVQELTMVLPDILVVYSEELVERVMQVSYFIPYELFRLMLLCWQPKVLKLRLRSEACCSFEDAARIEWDEEDIFSSTTLFNCPLFDRCKPICLGSEEDICKCKLIVDATGSRLFDPIFNEKNYDTAGRDFLVIFPMRTILIKRTIPLKTGSSVKTQIKQQLDYIVNTVFCNAQEHQERAVNFELTFLNAKEVRMSVVRKCVPQTMNGKKIGISFEAEQETKNLFMEFGNSTEGRNLFVNFFDDQNQVLVDLKIILSD